MKEGCKPADQLARLPSPRGSSCELRCFTFTVYFVDCSCEFCIMKWGEPRKFVRTGKIRAQQNVPLALYPEQRRACADPVVSVQALGTSQDWAAWSASCCFLPNTGHLCGPRAVLGCRAWSRQSPALPGARSLTTSLPSPGVVCPTWGGLTVIFLLVSTAHVLQKMCLNIW